MNYQKNFKFKCLNCYLNSNKTYTTGSPQEMLKLAAVLDIGGNKKNVDKIFLKQEKNKVKSHFKLFCNFNGFNFKDHNGGLNELNTLYISNLQTSGKTPVFP